ncbi:MAG: phosphatidylglycerophosphatase A family protein [Nitrospiria bacterium]
MNRFHQFVATGAYSGYFPKMPGTFASVIGILLFYPMVSFTPLIQILMILILFFLGVWSSFSVEKALGETDPGIIVVDEIAGIWISIFLVPFQWKFLFVAVILFRILDIKKPFPIDQIQSLKGGWGVMLDDCLAGLFTNLSLQAFLYFWPVTA